MPFRLVIFDLDGTLVDSSTDITIAINHAIRPFGLDEITVEKTISLIGEGVTRLFEKLLGEDSARIGGPVMERFLDYYGAHLAEHTRPYPGVAATLAALAGCQKAVVSNKREKFSRDLLAVLGLVDAFDLILGSDSVPEKKPSPRPILHAMAFFGVSPGETAVVGDSPYDIEAGKAAGATTVAVTYGFRPAESLRDADYLIDSFEALLPILKQERLTG